MTTTTTTTTTATATATATTTTTTTANCYWSNRFHELLLVEGNLDVKFPTIWTDGKAEVGRIREEKERRAEKGRVKTKKMQMREKLEKSRSATFSNVSWLRRVEK